VVECAQADQTTARKQPPPRIDSTHRVDLRGGYNIVVRSYFGGHTNRSEAQPGFVGGSSGGYVHLQYYYNGYDLRQYDEQHSTKPSE